MTFEVLMVVRVQIVVVLIMRLFTLVDAYELVFGVDMNETRT
jgi:hypothetical protein